MWIRVCRSVVLGKFRWNHSICPCVVLFPSQAKFLGSIAFSVHHCMLNAELSCFISSAQGPGHRKYRTFMTFIYIRIHKYTYIYIYICTLLSWSDTNCFPPDIPRSRKYRTYIYTCIHKSTYIYIYLYVPFSLDLIQIASLRIFPGAGNIAHICLYTCIHKYIYSIFNFFSLNIHFRCLNIYFFQDKMFYGSNPIISWNKTDTGAFLTMILRIFAEYDKNCFTHL